MKLFTVIGAALLLAGCVAGPDYHVPEASAPDPDSAVANVQPDWWRAFADDGLTAAVDEALLHNRNLAVASARLAEARAGRRAARAVFWPTIGVDAGYTWYEQSINSPQGPSSLIGAGLIDREDEFWSAIAGASWEADLFGGNRRAAQAADAREGAARAGLRGVQLAVATETASAWLEWQGNEARRALAERNVALQRQSFEITQQKVAIGLVPELDALRAEAQLAATQARLPTLSAAADAARFRLRVLTGNPPQAADGEPMASGLPALPPAVPAGTPADLLRRRPDVAAAERELAAAVADIGVAQARFFPSLTIAANGGFESATTGELFDSASRLLGIMPSLSLPLFTGGALRANKAAAIARADAARAGYEQAVLEALRDVLTAQTLLRNEHETRAALAISARAAGEALRIAQGLYDRGLADFLSLLDAQRTALDTDDALVASEIRLRLNTVRLYAALGGGW